MSSIWKSWGASVAGPSHLKLGIVNQDAWISRHYSWGDVVVVSDGLGSRQQSDLGAKAACLSVLEAAKVYQKHPNTKIENILRLVHSYWLIKLASFEVYDCSATCLFIIRLKDKCLLARLGDGLIVICGKNNDESVLLTDDKQNTFSNITNSLGQEFKASQWETKIVQPDQCNAIVLCTDGISDDIMPDKQSQFAQKLYRSYYNSSYKKRTADLYRWLKDWPVPHHSDDKTIACLFKKEGVSE